MLQYVVLLHSSIFKCYMHQKSLRKLIWVIRLNYSAALIHPQWFSVHVLLPGSIPAVSGDHRLQSAHLQVTFAVALWELELI